MPVTNRHIEMLSGSTRKDMSTCSAPTGIQVNSLTTWTRSSLPCESRSLHTPTATRNDAPSIVVASHPAFGSPSLRPTTRMIRKPASGRAGISQTTSIIGESTPELVEVVGRGAGAAAQDRDDDAQADDNFGGGDDEHEEHRRLPADVAQLHGEGDERQVDRVEHQLDAHEQHERVASHHHAERTDSEQNGGEDHVPRGGRLHDGAHVATLILRDSRTVPTTAITRSAEVSSKANTWLENRSRAR